MTTACPRCQWSPVSPDANWGFLGAISYAGYIDGCDHLHGMRRCDSCSQDWYRVGNDSTWDVDGCSREDCPECLASDDFVTEPTIPMPTLTDGELRRLQLKEVA